ncbi:MAG TPA: YwiC-like family protein [Anaerolineales bacterium]|nr:YwiC-like family protein [Anaerolineales bacterium]
MTGMADAYFRRQIFLPQDHGSWVFILSPLFIGIFAGGKFTVTSLSLVAAAMTAFLLRQPVTMAVKAYAGRRPKSDLPPARFWIAAYGIIVLVAVAGLILAGFWYILLLAIPGALVFVWHLWLVSKREERRQVNVELVATGVLSLAAPAAYWVGLGRYDAAGWWLWVLVWFQTAASIVYAYLRLEQRDLAQVPARREMWKMGWRSFAYTTFNLSAALLLGLTSVLPPLIFLPYLIQWSETLWGIFHPAIKWKPTQIGIRQLIVSILWTIAFIATWRL